MAVGGELAYLMVRIGANIQELDDKLGEAWGSVNNWVKKSTTAMNTWKDENKSMVNTVGRNMALMGAAITGATGLAVKSLMQFESGMNLINTALSGSSKQFLPEFEKGIRSLGEKSSEGFDTIQRGMYSILQAMIPASQAMSVLTEANRSAVAGMTDTATAAEGITRVMNAYGMSAEEAGRVSDWFTTVIQRGNVRFDELASSIGRIAPIASSAGITLEDMGAMIQLLTRNGLDASTAMTSVRSVIQAFQKPTDEAKQLAKDLGFEMSSSALRANGLRWAMEQVNKASEDEVGILVGNIRAKTATAIATSKMGQLEADYAAQLDKTGSTLDIYNQRTGTSTMQMGSLMKAIQNLTDEAVKPLMPPLLELIGKAREIVEGGKKWIENNKELANNLIKIVAVLGPVLIGLGGIVKMSSLVVTAIQAIITAGQGLYFLLATPLGLAITTTIAAIALMTKKWLEWKDAQKQAADSTKNAIETQIDVNKKLATEISTWTSRYKEMNDVDAERLYNIQQRIKITGELLALMEKEGASAFHLAEATRAHRDAIAEWKDVRADLVQNYGAEIAAQDELAGKEEEAAQRRSIFRDDMQAEAIEILEMTERYRGLNQQLAENTITKEDYSKAVMALIKDMQALGMPMDKVLAKLNELDETDPNIEIKMKVFGLEQITDVKERIKRMNEEIVLSQLEGDEKTRKSLEFNLQHELDAIQKKMIDAKYAYEQKILLLDAEYEHEQRLFILSTEKNKEKQAILLNDLRERIEAQKTLEKSRFDDLMKLYGEEIDAHKRLTAEKIKDLEDEKKASAAPTAPAAQPTVTGGGGGVIGTGLTEAEIAAAITAGFSGKLPKVISGFSEPSAWFKENFPVLSGQTVGSFQRGTASVPKTGLAIVHKGEEIIPAGRGGSEGVAIINLFDEALIPQIMAKYPNAIINPVLKSMIGNPTVRKVMRSAVG